MHLKDLRPGMIVEFTAYYPDRQPRYRGVVIEVTDGQNLRCCPWKVAQYTKEAGGEEGHTIYKTPGLWPFAELRTFKQVKSL